MSNLKPIVSVTEMSKMVQLSRARFYQLLDIGFFPKPLHDERSNRPYYNEELQQVCIEARQTGIGYDGSSMMLFYSPRKNGITSMPKKQKVDPIVKEMAETLSSMGLEVTVKQVQQAIVEIYPDGTDGQEQGVIIRELFRFLKQKM